MMVKKILLDGSPCAKCAQAEQMLRKRGYWERIDSVVYAEEGNKESPGMILAAERDIELAPFFIVSNENEPERIYTRVLEFIKKELEVRETSASVSEDSDLEALNRKFSTLDPREILNQVQSQYGDSLVLAFSGAEDIVLIDMAKANKLPFSVFCLDTGRLHGETYEYLDRVRNHYDLNIEIFTPSATLLEPFVNEKGMNSFYRDGHSECCGIRKVEPLNRALKNRRAWATGLRRDQSPATRGNLNYIESDEAHKGSSGKPIAKVNPLLDWSSQQVWEYIREKKVPYNALHDAGYRSIGCQPCTRVSRPGEHERAARWWWEDGTKRECGLHLK